MSWMKKKRELTGIAAPAIIKEKFTFLYWRRAHPQQSTKQQSNQSTFFNWGWLMELFGGLEWMNSFLSFFFLNCWGLWPLQRQCSATKREQRRKRGRNEEMKAPAVIKKLVFYGGWRKKREWNGIKQRQAAIQQFIGEWSVSWLMEWNGADGRRSRPAEWPKRSKAKQWNKMKLFWFVERATSSAIKDKECCWLWAGGSSAAAPFRSKRTELLFLLQLLCLLVHEKRED